jgi:hypothetical protein
VSKSVLLKSVYTGDIPILYYGNHVLGSFQSATPICIPTWFNYSVPSNIEDVVFSEPSGGLNAFAMVAGSLAMLSVYVYVKITHDYSATYSLIGAIGFALSGVAESLPTERRQMAGGLRLTAILVLLGLISLTAFAPEVILGPR